MELEADGAPGTVTLRRVGDGEAATFYARSDHTVGWVVVNRHVAAELERDLDGLLR